MSPGWTLPLVSAVCAVVLLAVLLEMKRMSADDEGWWTRSILQGRKVRVRTDWSLCMGAASCTELAPKVFRLDWSRRKSVFDPAPLEVREDREAKAVDIFRAAQSCPYHAIILEDEATGERLFPT